MVLSLRGKLVLSHLVAIFLATASLGFLLLSLVRGYFLNSLEQSLMAQSHLVVQALIPGATSGAAPTSLPPVVNAVQQQQIGNLSVQVENAGSGGAPDDLSGPGASNLDYLHEASVDLLAALDTHIRVLDAGGVVLVDSRGDDQGRDLSGDPGVGAALAGDARAQLQEVGGAEWLFVSVPIFIEGRVAGAVVLGQPLRDVSAVLADLRNRLLLALAVAVPLSAGVGLALARNIARPVHALTTAARRLGGGDFDVPLYVDGRDELGELSRTFAAMRDRLQAVERMRLQFVSDVSHELRTPLTAIKGLAETLRDGAVEDPAVRDRFLANVEGETDRLIRLVNDLLTLSRADSQGLALRREVLDLCQLACSTVEKLGPQAEARGVELDVRLPDSPLYVWADPDRLEGLLVNLIDNGLKHTPRGGRVRVLGAKQAVTAEAVTASAPPLPEGRWALIRVADTGEGIPPQDLPHVFERFYRADHSRSRERGGSGLGLSIAKAVIEAHGGHIWLESPSSALAYQGSGPGTCVFFALPIAPR